MRIVGIIFFILLGFVFLASDHFSSAGFVVAALFWGCAFTLIIRKAKVKVDGSVNDALGKRAN